MRDRTIFLSPLFEDTSALPAATKCVTLGSGLRDSVETHPKRRVALPLERRHLAAGRACAGAGGDSPPRPANTLDPVVSWRLGRDRPYREGRKRIGLGE